MRIAARMHAGVFLMLLGWLAAWTPCAAVADDAYFNVRDARTQLKDGVYLLDANVVYRFSEAAMEALQNGIPLVLEIQIKVGRQRAWLWTDTIAALNQRHRLQFHALSDRYVVHNLNTDQRQSFATLDDALYALGAIRGFPMLDQRLLVAGADYQVGVRAALVVEELPTPMRLWAYASEQWHLDSAWYTWRLQP
ncbi:MAG: DUF4390 domain-containing protein [Gammaproteobacteria bacterium]|nr:DUF4390 domain-containing protein [Gammaproteobacteria bacterium]